MIGEETPNGQPAPETPSNPPAQEKGPETASQPQDGGQVGADPAANKPEPEAPAAAGEGQPA